jgi:hypothetical protein
MILTHFLALLASPPLLVNPAAAVLPLTSSQPLVSGGRLELALVPALKVRAAPAVLPVREH